MKQANGRPGTTSPSCVNYIQSVQRMHREIVRILRPQSVQRMHREIVRILRPTVMQTRILLSCTMFLYALEGLKTLVMEFNSRKRPRVIQKKYNFTPCQPYVTVVVLSLRTRLKREISGRVCVCVFVCLFVSLRAWPKNVKICLPIMQSVRRYICTFGRVLHTTFFQQGATQQQWSISDLKPIKRLERCIRTEWPTPWQFSKFVLCCSPYISGLALGPTQPHTRRVTGTLPPEVKRQGREAHHSPPSNVKVCSYTATPHMPSWHSA
jgi:hypothetical protein